MLPFKDLTLDDIGLIEQYLQYQKYRTSEYSVAGIFMWRSYFDIAFCIVDDMLFIRKTYQSETPFFSVPVGPGNLTRALEQLAECCRESGQGLRFATVPEEARPILQQTFGKPLSISCNRDWFDYLYLADKLAALKGKKYKTQRNHVNKFIRLYGNDYRLEKIDQENIEQVKEFYKQYVIDYPPSGSLATAESIAVAELLDHYYFDFAALGYCLKIKDQVAGFAIGEIINDTLYVHIEKGSLEWHGTYQMLVSGFAGAVLTQVKYINREEDVGDEGLRRSKLSYNPVKLLTKHTIRVSR